MSNFATTFNKKIYLIPVELFREYEYDLSMVDTLEDLFKFEEKYLPYNNIVLGNNVGFDSLNPLGFFLRPKSHQTEGFYEITISDATQYNQEEPTTKEDFLRHLTQRNFETTKLTITKPNGRGYHEKIEFNLTRETLINLIQVFNAIEKLME